jgi:glycosyltransferase involved in cell wall biosynthesis
MKITIVTGAFFPVPAIMGGAVEKVWFALGREFARRGHEVVHVSRAHPELPRKECIAGVTHLRVPGFDQPRSIIRLKFLDLIYSWRIRRALPQADILVTNTFWLPIIERRADRGLIYVHVQRGPKGQMRWYARAARLLAVSNAIADAILAQAPELRDKVRVIPNPVPFEIAETNSARDKTILFVGRIHPEKGVELLLQALRALPAEKFADWKVKLIGPHETRFGGGGDEFLCAMQPLAEQSPVPVEWRGPVFEESELRAQYRSAAVFVYPSVAETGDALPVAPLEAMANGCVPVVSALPVFRDYIEDGVTGFVFDHRGERGAENLAGKLSEVLSLHSAMRKKMGDAARAKAAEFALEPVAQRYLDDFATLLAQAHKARSTSA